MNDVIKPLPRPDLIQLQNAHATKHPGAGQPWKIEANISNERIGRLSGSFTENQVFEILKFARHFEQVAFEAGIAFQKKYSDSLFKGRIDHLIKCNEIATNENERLAEKLASLIGEKE